MLIRQARSEDAIAACDVIRSSIERLCEADHKNNPTYVRRWLANKTPENVAIWIRESHLFVAEEGGELVGVAAVTPTGHITLNYVRPQARFRGISKALLRQLEDRARELGCAECRLKSTQTAFHFYLNAGYRRAGAGEDETDLFKPLSATVEAESVRGR